MTHLRLKQIQQSPLNLHQKSLPEYRLLMGFKKIWDKLSDIWDKAGLIWDIKSNIWDITLHKWDVTKNIWDKP
jgi:hypothetical protein